MEGGAFNNLAGSTINVQSPLNILGSSSAANAFTNAGTFRQTVTTGTTTFGVYDGYTPVAFSNSGTVDIQTGTLSLQGGGTIAAGATFTGAGFTRFGGGTMTVNGAATGTNLALDGGTLTGAGDLTVTTEFDWTGGTLSGTGKLILGAGVPMNLTGASGVMTGGNRPVDSTAAGAAVNWTGGYLAGTFANQGPFNLGGSAFKILTGTVNQSGPGTGVWGGTGTLSVEGGAFNNLAGSTINVQSPLNILGSSSAANAFTNAGTFRQTVTTGTTTFGVYDGYTPVAFNNSGTVDIQTGTLSFLGGLSNSGDVIIAGALTAAPGYIQTGGSTILAGGTLGAPIVNLDGGALSGSGSVIANVDNTAGQINPGAAGTAGVIAITGNYTQGASNVLSIDIGGLIAGSQFDQLSISGTATLNGTLNVGLITPFLPDVGNSFKIMTFSSRSPADSDFATYNGLNLPNGLVFTPVYHDDLTPADLTLTILNQASPTINTTQLPASATVGSSIADKATVSGGDSPTGTVTFTLYSNPNGTGTPLYTSLAVTLVGGMATSPGYTTTATGTDYWVATYNGDSNNSPVTSGTALEPVVITTASPAINTSQQPATATVGTSIADQATVSGGDNPTGTVTFTLYSNPNGTGTPLYTSPAVTLVGGMATSPGYTTTATGTDYWVATYNGDSNNSPVTSGTALEPVVITTASPAINTSQQPATATVGTSIADKATVTGGDNPTGTVTFNLYNNSTASGTPLFTDTETLSGGMATSASYPTTATGTDYWVATYNGDSNNNPVTSGTASEPVVISPASPAINTSQQPASATVGNSIADQATVSGGDSPTGTVTFTLYSNPNGTGTPLFTDANVPLSGGMATSTGYTATATGTDYWVATYNGDSNNSPVTSGTALEPVVITTASPAINTSQQPASATVGTSIADQATVSGGDSPTGTVTFNLYNNSSGSGTPLFTDTEPLSSGMATSTGYIAAATGTDYWVATYNGDSNNASVTSGTADEPVTIGQASPTINTSQLPASATVGSSIADKATVSGGYNPTGTVTFNLYSNSSGTGTVLFTDTATLSGGTATSKDYIAAATGTDYWVATYNGDSNNNVVSSGTASEPVTITANLVSPTIVTTASPNGTIYVGTTAPTLKDSATVTGGNNPTGTVTFYLFAPGVIPAGNFSNALYHETDPLNLVSGQYVASTATGYNKETATGTYQWEATSSGDVNNKPASDTSLAPGAGDDPGAGRQW